MIHQHDDIVNYLQSELERRQASNPNYSLRAWARDLNLSEAASLSAVLNRKRALSKPLAEKIKCALHLDDRDGVYFDLLVNQQAAKSERDRHLFADLIKRFKSQYETVAMSLDRFEVVASWYHLVILELARMPGFDLTVDNIRRRLTVNLDPLVIGTALRRLEQTKLLVRNDRGALKRAEDMQHVETEPPHSAFASHHRGMIKQALTALDQQDMNRRDFSGFQTLTRRSKIPEAKRRITQFRRELMAFLDDPDGDTVYQLNVQLFDHLN